MKKTRYTFVWQHLASLPYAWVSLLFGVIAASIVWRSNGRDMLGYILPALIAGLTTMQIAWRDRPIPEDNLGLLFAHRLSAGYLAFIAAIGVYWFASS